MCSAIPFVVSITGVIEGVVIGPSGNENQLELNNIAYNMKMVIDN